MQMGGKGNECFLQRPHSSDAWLVIMLKFGNIDGLTAWIFQIWRYRREPGTQIWNSGVDRWAEKKKNWQSHSILRFSPEALT